VAAVLLGLGVAASKARMPAWLRLVAWSAVILGIPGVILTGARTVWIALVVALGVGLLVVTIHRPRVVVRRAVPPLLALLLVVGAMAALHFDPRTLIPAFNPHQTGSIMQRVASFGSLSRERDLTVRVEIYRNALTHWQQHPWIGWGVGAYGEVYRYPYPDQVHPGWISNLFIHVLYDSGLLGLAFFLGGLAWAGCRGVRAWRGAQGIEAGMLAGTLLALLGLLIAFQSTEATWFAYPWIYLGLLEGAIFSAGRRSRPEYPTVTPRM
jgi:O-antigen ligase